MKKIFDIRKGHYVVLNEDEQSDATQQNTAQGANDAAQQAADKARQLNSETQEKLSRLDVERSNIQKNYQTQKANIETKYGTDISAQQQLIASGNQAVANAVDSASRSKAMSDVLNIRKKIADIELKKVEDQTKADLDYAKEVHRIELLKLQVQMDANAATVAEKWSRLPEKYRMLNESNIHQAKIYMKTLIDEDNIIRDMRDFKRVFKDSNLVYGKDKEDFYVLCIDQDDFSRLYEALMNAGYLRDDIFAVVMPQVLDRSSLIDKQN